MQSQAIDVPITALLPIIQGNFDVTAVPDETVNFVRSLNKAPLPARRDADFAFYAERTQFAILRFRRLIGFEIGDQKASLDEVLPILRGNFTKQTVAKFSLNAMSIIALVADTGGGTPTVESTMRDGPRALNSIVECNRSIRLPVNIGRFLPG